MIKPCWLMETSMENWITILISIITGLGIWFFTTRIYKCLFMIHLILEKHTNRHVYLVLKNGRDIPLNETKLKIICSDISPRKFLKLFNNLTFDKRVNAINNVTNSSLIDNINTYHSFNIANLPKISNNNEYLIVLEKDFINSEKIIKRHISHKYLFICLYDEHNAKVLKFFRYSFDCNIKNMFKYVAGFFIKDSAKTLLQTMHTKVI